MSMRNEGAQAIKNHLMEKGFSEILKSIPQPIEKIYGMYFREEDPPAEAFLLEGTEYRLVFRITLGNLRSMTVAEAKPYCTDDPPRRITKDYGTSTDTIPVSEVEALLSEFKQGAIEGTMQLPVQEMKRLEGDLGDEL